MKRIILAVTTLLCLLAPVSASAYDPLKNACDKQNGDASSSAACSADGSDPITGKNGVLSKASAVLATIGAIAAILIIIVAGFRYVTANGDAQRASSAQSAIIGAVVGLVIIAAAEAIVIFVVKKL